MSNTTASFRSLGLAVLAASAFSATQASAVEVHSNDFSAAKGFTEGGALNGAGGFLADGTYTTVDVAANGEITTNTGFKRAHKDVGTAFAVVDTITFSAGVRSTRGTNTGGAPDILRFGLGSLVSSRGGGVPLNSSEVEAGALLGANGSDWTLRNFGSGAATEKTTALPLTDACNTLTTVVAQLATQDPFSVSTGYGSSTRASETVTNADLYAADEVFGLFLTRGAPNVGSLGIDNVSLSVTTDVIPEPASLALVGLDGLALLGRRRKQAAHPSGRVTR